MVNTAYVKLKSLQIGYTFKPQLLKKAKMQSLRLYADFYNKVHPSLCKLYS